MKRLFRPGGGFTLLEIIMTLVILGVVAILGVSFFSAGVTRTDIALNQLQVDADLQLVLENMIQDAGAEFTNNLTGLSDKIGANGTTSTVYGQTDNGGPVSYYIADKRFVCPDSDTKTFNTMPTTNQFLLVTIKPNATSGVSLTYIFADNNAVAGATTSCK